MSGISMGKKDAIKYIKEIAERMGIDISIADEKATKELLRQDFVEKMQYAMLTQLNKELGQILKPQLTSSTFPQASFITRYDTFNTAVTLNTNILATSISANTTPTGFLNIYCCFDTLGTLSLMRTSGGTTVAEKLNGGTALAANTAYSFTSIPVATGETINLQYSASATALKLNIVESTGNL